MELSKLPSMQSIVLRFSFLLFPRIIKLIEISVLFKESQKKYAQLLYVYLQDAGELLNILA